MEALTISNYIDRRDPTILAHYGAILGHIQSNACYKPSALAEWAKGTVADPWLISTAKAKGYTIITFEVPNKGLNPRSPSKNAKIPDVANVFGVKTENLFYMMRDYIEQVPEEYQSDSKGSLVIAIDEGCNALPIYNRIWS